MKQLERPSSTRTDSLFNLLATEFDDALRAYDLFNEFLQCRFYSRSYSVKLLSVAKGEAGDAWEIRRLATLMLEHQLSKLPAEAIDEFDLLFTRLNLKARAGL